MCVFCLPLISRDARQTPGPPSGGLFLLLAALSLAWTASFWDGVNGLMQLLLLAGMFRIGMALPSLRPAYIGFGLGFAFNALIVLVQVLEARDETGPYLLRHLLPELNSPGGLFLSSNFLAEPAALCLIGLIGYRVWWLVAPVLPCIAFTHARGAVLGLAAAAIVGIWGWNRRAAAALSVAAAVMLALAFVREDAGGSMHQRIAIWHDTLMGLTFFGHGIGSFYQAFAAHADWHSLLTTRPNHPHNEFLFVLYELGVPGAVLFIMLTVAILRGSRQTEKLIFIALLVESSFAFPTHLPVSGALGALVAGHLFASWSFVWGSARVGRSGIRHWSMAQYLPGSGNRPPDPRPAGVPAAV